MGIVILFITALFVIVVYYAAKGGSKRRRRDQTTSYNKQRQNKQKTNANKKPLKPFRKDLVMISTTPSTTFLNQSYIDNNLGTGTEVELDLKRDIVIGPGNKVLGTLSNERRKLDRVKLTLKEYPDLYACISGHPYVNEYSNQLSGVYDIYVFIGWDPNFNFEAMKLKSELATKGYHVKHNPCLEYIPNTTLSNNEDILWRQANLMVNTGYLENALEAYLKLWRDKGVWYHDLVVIARKLKKYPLEKELILEYKDKYEKDNYDKRLKVVEQRLS